MKLQRRQCKHSCHDLGPERQIDRPYEAGQDLQIDQAEYELGNWFSPLAVSLTLHRAGGSATGMAFRVGATTCAASLPCKIFAVAAIRDRRKARPETAHVPRQETTSSDGRENP